MHLISPKNSRSFFVERDNKKGQLDLQITKISGKKVETADKKIHEVFISRIGKKRKNSMYVHDFVIIRGQQGFEEEKESNPIDIKVENNKMQNIFDK